MAKKKKKIEDSFNYGALIMLVFACLLLYFSFSKAGILGTVINNVLSFVFGPYYLAILITAIVIFFIASFLKRKYDFTFWFYLGLVFLNIAILLLGAFLHNDDPKDFSDCLTILHSFNKITDPKATFLAGLLPSFLYTSLYLLINYEATFIVIMVLFALSAFLIVPLGIYKTIISGVKTSSKQAVTHLKERSQELNEQRRLEHERQEKEKAAKLEAERLALAEQMNREYSDPVPEPQEIFVKEIPLEEKPSEFTSTYFIEADKSKSEVKKEETKETVRVLKVSRSSGNYHLPPLNLLDNVSTSNKSNVNYQSAGIKGKRLIEILKNFDIDAKLVETHIGPSVTKFEIHPDSNVKVNKILSIQDNLKMELAARDIRIEAPIPGKNAVGIEIPNVETTTVKMNDLMKNSAEMFKKSKLTFALGKDLMGKNVYCELNKMPHLLIAGATGSGKSVCINTIITSFLLKTNPDDVKLVLVDPKKVEFTPYHDVPHLLWPVVTEADMASLLLKKLVIIMEERYQAFADVGVRDINSFNSFVEKYNDTKEEDKEPMQRLPYIVIIIDELADLMQIAKKDVEGSIQRITQLARACGMHLIVATQRPSTDVITGIIKSNIPSRISFAVASSIDSRTILDSVGAERLLGNGDMLYSPQGSSSPLRLQGAYVTDEEIRRLTDFVKKEAKPNYDDTYFELKRNNDSSASDLGPAFEKDSMYDEVVEYIKEAQKASTSLLQRRFGIGYNRAARIIDQLEKNGMIGPANGSKPREVYIKKDDE